ncbi:MAG: argonaute/piwi family protein [Candidatus Polarisedimenticolia bacterium]
MKLWHLDEPQLEFGGGGTHIDVRFGLMLHGPVDLGTANAPSDLRLGVVGTQQTIEQLVEWLERCQKGVPAKSSRRGNLFPRFPGFSLESSLRSRLIIDDRWAEPVHGGEISGVVLGGGRQEAVRDAADLFLDRVRRLHDRGGPMVVVCAPPEEMLASLEGDVKGVQDVDEELDEGSETHGDRRNVTGPAFHDLLKAKALSVGIPLQMVRPETYGQVTQSSRRKAKSRRGLQDEATRAWNFHTALYYKAGGIPWRLRRESSDLTSCYVGISFYKSASGDRLISSMAQVFNERGEGTVVQGGLAQIDKEDRQPHMSEGDAAKLLEGAIASYKVEHRTVPARVIVHKTSSMNNAELAGFRSGAKAERVDTLELLSVRRSLSRLFRHGTYPPLRGTYLELDARTHLLYLRGSVSFFETYPGLYVPRPFEFRVVQGDSTGKGLAEEAFALSKLNWNNTQFDGGEPITVRAARRVGSILKHVESGEVSTSRFRFFM